MTSETKRKTRGSQIPFPGIGAYEWRVGEDRIVWSEELARIYGFDAGAAGPGFEAFVHPEDRPVLAETHSRLLPGASYELEFRIVRADGEVRHIHDRGVLVEGADGAHVLRGVHIDVTLQRAPASGLPAINFREVAESLPQLVWTCDATGACDYLSPQWARYTGVPAEEQLGAGWLERLHPDDREPAWARWRETARRGLDYECEFRIRRKDGAYRWFRTLAKPLRDHDGQIRKWFGSNTDIEDLKRAEAARRESEASANARAAELETLYNAAPIGIGLFDRDFRFVRVNERLAEINGAPAEALAGKGIEEALPEVTVSTLRAIEPRLARGEEVRNAEVSGFEADGRRFAYVLNYRPLRGEAGDVTHYLGTVQDISDRKRMEDALVESESRFRGVFEHAFTGISITDFAGRHVSCNPAYEAMLGERAERLVGTPLADSIHHEDREANRAQVERLIAGEIDAFEIEHRYIHASGDTVWARKHVSLLRDARGRPTHVIALVTDMTEQKRHEARQQLLLRELNHRSKNQLALIMSIARQTAAKSPGEFLPRFEQRLRAMASAQDLLVRNESRSATIEELLTSQLAPYGGLEERVAVSGDEIAVTATAAESLGLAFHELATNAAKYGALSTPPGRIDVAWSIGRDDEGLSVFRLSWIERGGPPAAPPTSRGFGTSLLERLIPSAFDGKVEYAFGETGVSWRLTCPLDRVVARGSATGDAPGHAGVAED